VLFIDGIGIRVCDDTGGSKIRGRRVDVFFASHKEAERFGVQTREAELLWPFL
jgi:3D (Asp-Asp-Asp) domain-containing protein